MILADTFPKSHRNQEKYIVNAIKNKLFFETTFQSFKLKQNGNGLLLIHIVHEIEAMYSSRFFMLIVPILKWSTSTAYYLLKWFTFESIFDQNLDKSIKMLSFNMWPAVPYSEVLCPH